MYPQIGEEQEDGGGGGVDDPAPAVLVACPARVVVQDQKDQGRERH